MPNYHRVLVRYRENPAPEEAWSALHWCDIEHDPATQNIQVKLASAAGEQMPASTDFRVITSEQARKLLVWDVIDSRSAAYCLIVRETEMYRFSFLSQSQLFMQRGQAWSFTNNNFSRDSACGLGLATVFSNPEQARDSRLAMRTQKTYNYDLLHDATIVDRLSVLRAQYERWQVQKAQEEAEKEEQLRIETEKKEMQARELAARELAAVEAAASRDVRAPAPSYRDRLVPGYDNISDEELAREMQEAEIANAAYGLFVPSPYNNGDLDLGRENYLLDQIDQIARYEALCREGKAEQERRRLAEELPDQAAIGIPNAVPPSRGRIQYDNQGLPDQPYRFFQPQAQQHPPNLRKSQLMAIGVAVLVVGWAVASSPPWVTIAFFVIFAALLGLLLKVRNHQEESVPINQMYG